MVIDALHLSRQIMMAKQEHLMCHLIVNCGRKREHMNQLQIMK